MIRYSNRLFILKNKQEKFANAVVAQEGVELSKKIQQFSKDWGPTISVALPVATALTTGGIWLAKKIHNKIQLAESRRAIYKMDAMAGIPREDIDRAFNLLKDTAPYIAANPIMAANFIRKYYTYGLVDPSELETLISASKEIEYGGIQEMATRKGGPVQTLPYIGKTIRDLY